MKILAIETSCDETAAAVVRDVPNGGVEVIAHRVYSQIAKHQQFGGVFPEVASREHLKKIGPIIEETLRQAAGDGAKPAAGRRWLADHIDAIAVTAGPGLIGSLLVGVSTAKALAYGLSKPLLGINHHEGHLLAAWIRPDDATAWVPPQLPAIALVVSGGHTKIVRMLDFGHFQELGRTRDDAVGEGFDKAARLLRLPYPGGPQLSRLAAAYRGRTSAAPAELPRPMLDSGTYEFSFSGLKTAVSHEVNRRGQLRQSDKEELACAFEDAAVDVLVGKTRQALEEFRPRSVIVAGGVAANSWLRRQLSQALASYPNISLHIPPIDLCTDNAAMIGAAALKRALNNQVTDWYDVYADEQKELDA